MSKNVTVVFFLCPFKVNYIEYADEIAELIGCRPNLTKLLFKDPLLALRCFFGPCVPYQYRLLGPGAWDGAKEAIEAVDANIIYPTRTRVVMQDKSTGSPNTIKIAIASFLIVLLSIIVRYFILS